MNERQAYYKRAPINYLSAALQQPKANFSKPVTLYWDCHRAARKKPRKTQLQQKEKQKENTAV